jgi:hypothetical protein
LHIMSDRACVVFAAWLAALSEPVRKHFTSSSARTRFCLSSAIHSGSKFGPQHCSQKLVKCSGVGASRCFDHKRSLFYVAVPSLSWQNQAVLRPKQLIFCLQHIPSRRHRWPLPRIESALSPANALVCCPHQAQCKTESQTSLPSQADASRATDSLQFAPAACRPYPLHL